MEIVYRIVMLTPAYAMLCCAVPCLLWVFLRLAVQNVI